MVREEERAEKVDMLRTELGVIVIIIGLVLVMIAYYAAVVKWAAAADVSTAVGSVTTVIGTLVGFFFGNTAGSTGKERAQAARVTAEQRLGRMYGLAYKHEPTAAEDILKS